MRPGWLTMATGLMSTHKEHKQAVASLNKAVVDIIGKVTLSPYVSEQLLQCHDIFIMTKAMQCRLRQS